jgi:hypothetical protein
MGKWTVEGVQDALSCYQRACITSLRVAQAQSKDVVVRYHGPRDKPNRLPNQSDFITHPDGTRDFKIDPTWYEHFR